MKHCEILKIVSAPLHIPIAERTLLAALTLRMWRSRGKGGLFARLWPLLTPFFLLVIYYCAFGVVLNLRSEFGGANYALFMFSGIAVFNIFSESLSGGAISVISQPGYVKNAGFSLEVLPLAAVGCALFSGTVFLAVTLAAAALGPGLSLRVFLLPLVLLPYLFFCMGTALLAGALSVFIRDFPQFAALLIQGLFFLTPVIYPAGSIPDSCRRLIGLNPLTGYVEAARSAVFGGAFCGWGWLWINGVAVYLLGFIFFHKTRRGFADVI